MLVAGLRRLKIDQDYLPKQPRTLAELEKRLAEGIARLDRGEGIDGEAMFRRLKERYEVRESDA